MIKRISPYVLIALFIALSCQNNDQILDIDGSYLGQEPPGLEPELFAEGVVSTTKDEVNAVFSPDGKEFYFARDTYQNLSSAGRDYTIMSMNLTASGWTVPKVASFSKQYMNADMSMTYDNRFLFFCSDRPKRKTDEREDNSNVWFVKRTPRGWSEPIYAGDILNSLKNEWYPTATQDGVIYFSSSRNVDNKGDIYKIDFDNGKFANLENIGSPINTPFGENDVFISKDESFMIVSSSDRPEGFGSGDLYLSIKQSDGTWTRLKNMGEPINSEALEYCPMISPDEKYLFFTSRRRGNDDIFWVSTDILK